MTMITSPNCGKVVSDKAEKCVHCGAKLTGVDLKMFCPRCGMLLETETDICPNCGYAFKRNNVATEVRQSKKSKDKVAIIVAVSLVAAVYVVSVAVMLTQKRKNDQIERYSSTFDLAAEAMATGSTNAVTCGDLIASVWYNAIHEKADLKTDKYTKPDGYFVNFNDALKNLFADDTFSSSIASIKENQKTVASLMKLLVNHPNDYTEAYGYLRDLYGAYLSLTNTVISPSGTYLSFSTNFNEYCSEVVKYCELIGPYLDQ